MVCIQCGIKTQVINSRLQKRRNTVWRRRQCLNCGAVFTTSETAEYAAAWAVIGADGQISPFSRDKLLLSLYKSLQHRSSALEDASDLVDTILDKLRTNVHEGALGRTIIMQTVEVALSRFDTAAATHYRAFHNQ